VGPNMGSAATPPSRLFTLSGAAAQLRCGAGISEPVQRYREHRVLLLYELGAPLSVPLARPRGLRWLFRPV